MANRSLGHELAHCHTTQGVGCSIPRANFLTNPDSKVHGTNMGPIWGRKDPGGPNVGPMNFAIWEWLSRALTRERRHHLYNATYMLRPCLVLDRTLKTSLRIYHFGCSIYKHTSCIYWLICSTIRGYWLYSIGLKVCGTIRTPTQS